MDKNKILNEVFGYENFRDGQEEIINNILDKRDCFSIMPTGSGKSLCFQIPALMFDGITLVISPLISLMQNQVSELIENGVKAAYINSSLNERQYFKVLENVKNYEYKIIYIAPERLDLANFISLSKTLNISMIVIDEAHCVSQWGQDFRPSYLNISRFVESLDKRPVVSAFTATANNVVKDDILNQLQLLKPKKIFMGYDRKNLHFKTLQVRDKKKILYNIVNTNKNLSGIIYCNTRKNVDNVNDFLIEKGFKSCKYHAGLSRLERHKNQEDFLYDRKPIVVATNAFGMGINKSDISYIVHYNMPKDMESYYQEAGRAGRDGENADCILLYSAQDMITNQFLIQLSSRNSTQSDDIKEEIIKNDIKKLNYMQEYSNTNNCLRKYILEYFNEETGNNCNNCANCLAKTKVLDITYESNLILNCVKESSERFGKALIRDCLKGANTQRIREFNLNKQNTYSSLKNKDKDEIDRIIAYLLESDYLKTSLSLYPTLSLSEKSDEILLDNETITMKVNIDEEITSFDDEDFEKADDSLYEKLKNLRKKISGDKNLPAYMIFHNSSLKDMCSKMPRNKNDFLKVSGVGKTKLNLYGDKFLDIINSHEAK